MSEHIDIYEEVTLPVIALRGIVAFPAVQVNIEIMRPISLKAFSASATMHDATVLLLSQKDISKEEPTAHDFYGVGVVAKIKHVVKNPHGNLSVVFEGVSRAKIKSIKEDDGYYVATAISRAEKEPAKRTQEIEVLMHEIKSRLRESKKLNPALSEEVCLAAEAISTPSYLADFVASSALLDYKNKQNVLEAILPKSRLEKLLIAMEEELLLMECEHDIQMQVRDKIDKSQKDYFLREQIKAIQSELGDDDDDEIKEYEEKIAMAADIPDEVREKLYKELSKLAKTPYGAAESTVIRTYLDTCLEFPFGKKSNAKVTVGGAKKILERDHYGLSKVKERILEFVAIKQFSPEVKNQIICLIGPPGVG